MDGCIYDSALVKEEAKGQLISECPFDVLNFPKNQQKKIWQIFALESKNGEINKIKALYYKTIECLYLMICSLFKF